MRIRHSFNFFLNLVFKLVIIILSFRIITKLHISSFIFQTMYVLYSMRGICLNIFLLNFLHPVVHRCDLPRGRKCTFRPLEFSGSGDASNIIITSHKLTRQLNKLNQMVSIPLTNLGFDRETNLFFFYFCLPIGSNMPHINKTAEPI